MADLIYGTSRVDRSGTVAAGGVAQVLMAANPSRRGFTIQNNSSGDLWINEFGAAAATQPSEKIPAGGYYQSPTHGTPIAAVSIFGATLGQAFSAREW